jgi:16S rRNA processing protein RimM
VVGRLGRPHGLQGYLTVTIDSDNPDRFRPGAQLTVESGRDLTVRDLRRGGARVLIAFKQVTDRSGAEALAGSRLSISPDQLRPLQPGEFWPEDLIGLEVRDGAGRVRGTVTGVDAEAPQTRLIVLTGTGSRLVPLVTDLVPEIAVEEGFLVVADLPGLLEEDSTL